jgi:hypothetical protein
MGYVLAARIEFLDPGDYAVTISTDERDLA